MQGLVSCQKCGYAFSRTSTQTSARKIHYYKCIGSDSWRKLGGPVCDNGRLVRQDLLDQIVWAEVIRLLEDPTLIQQELDRRLTAARSSDPAKKREQSLQRELAHVGKGIERLLSAYQEALMSIEQLRERMMPTVPLIMYSAFGDRLVENQARLIGISEVVSKSEHPSVLVHKARGLLYSAAA